MEFRNVTGSDLDVYQDGERTSVPAGGKLEVTGEAAERLLEQPDNWTRVDKPKPRNTDTKDGE